MKNGEREFDQKGNVMSTQDFKDDPGLSGKVAIVAGGGAAGDGIGNGRAAALLLARAGTKVLIVDLNPKLAERTVEMIAAEGGTAAWHSADLTVEAQARDTVTAAVDRFGRLDFLDNNIGISSRASVVEEDPDTWHRVLQVNLDPIMNLHDSSPYATEQAEYTTTPASIEAGAPPTPPVPPVVPGFAGIMETVRVDVNLTVPDDLVIKASDLRAA